MIKLKPLLAYIRFCYTNYTRQHRYIFELVAMIIFSIFFGGFLTSGDVAGNYIWFVLVAFGIILNLITAHSLFSLETGNTLYFLVAKPNGRLYLLIAKVLLILAIDLFLVATLAIVYGLRFWDATAFVALPGQLIFLALILLSCTLLMSLTYTIRPQIIWLVFILIVFGYILNKAPLFPIQSIAETAKLLVFLLPPLQELTFLAMDFDFTPWRSLFLIVAVLQIGILGYFTFRQMLRKDLF